MPQRFGIYSKSTPQAARLVITFRQYAAYANTIDKCGNAFRVIRAIVPRVPKSARDSRAKRANVQAPRRHLVAGMVADCERVKARRVA